MISDHLRYDSKYSIVWSGGIGESKGFTPSNPLVEGEGAFEDLVSDFISKSFLSLGELDLRFALDLAIAGKLEGVLVNANFVANFEGRRTDAQMFCNRLLTLFEVNLKHFEISSQGEKVKNLSRAEQAVLTLLGKLN